MNAQTKRTDRQSNQAGGELAISPDYSINLLVLAMIDDAARMARHGNGDDLQWLRTTGALWYEAIGRDGNELLRLADSIAKGRQPNSPARHDRQWKTRNLTERPRLNATA